MTPPPEPYEFGPFRLDTVRRVLWRGEEIVPLPPRALDLLVALVASAGEVVTKDELMERVWPGTFVEEANLSVNVSQLRRALGPGPAGRPYIETLSRRGYRFVPPAASAAPDVPTLAVLPFAPFASNPEDEALGAGLADAVITRLASTGRVAVRPTSAVLRFSSPDRDPREAARALRVGAVVDGRLQRAGDLVRVSVQLLTDGGVTPAWAATFDEPLTTLFAVQDRIASPLAAALALRLAPAERERLTRRYTADAEAYASYLRGRAHWSRFTGASIGRALALFAEAAARDPAYALPHAGLADLALVLGFSGLVPPHDAWARARAEATRALELDPELADAHVSLAYVALFAEWDWPSAEAGLRRALDLDPRSAAVRQWRGLFLALRGRLDRAAGEMAEARALDPVSVIGRLVSALVANLAGDHGREIEECQAAVEIDPAQFVAQWALGLAWEHQGKMREAVVAHERARELSEDSPLMQAVVARTLAAAGRRREARALLARLPSGGAGAYQRATLLVALGEHERALEALREAADARDPWMVLLKVDPQLRPLRRRKAFAELLVRVFPSTMVG